MTAPSALPPASATAGLVPTWQPAGTWPKNGQHFYEVTFRLVRWLAYKPDGQRQMKRKGRWQSARDFMGWQNSSDPTGAWLFAGKSVPDALDLLRSAPEMAAKLDAAMSALRDMEAASADVLSHRVEGATLGHLRDNDGSRAALGRLDAALSRARALLAAPLSTDNSGDRHG